jgi:tryptophan 7-halogenase
MIKKIVVAGAGFSGWYTALSLLQNVPDICITIIGSSKIPKLQVGEAMAFDGPYNLKNLLGFKDDRAFMRTTGAIYKYGVKLDEFNGDNNITYHSKIHNLKISSLAKFYSAFDYPDYYETRSARPGDAGIIDTWLWAHQQNPRTMTQFMDDIIDAQYFSSVPRAPYDANNNYILRPNDGFSYHFDADKTAVLMRDICMTKFPGQVKEIDAVIQAVKQDAQGHISGIVLEGDRTVSGDLYLDLTGFRRVIMSKLDNRSWIDHSHYAPDTAMVYPRKYTDPRTEMIGATTFSGLEHGWGFKINLYHRTGNGYCYMSSMAEKDKIHEYLQSQAGDYKVNNPLVISWKSGYYERPCLGNAIAFGLASGLIHPFDGNLIGTHSRGLENLIKLLNQQELSMPDIETQFNALQKPVLDEVALRMTLMLGFSTKSGNFWDLQRQRARDEHFLEQLQDIIEMKTKGINSRLVWNWQQAYARLVVSCNVDVSKFKLQKPSDRDLEMFTAFCQYNQARNKYIRESEWPNYYEWLKENRFDGRTSDEIFDELNY